MNRSTLVIPCYNEAARLDDAALLALVAGVKGDARVDAGARGEAGAPVDGVAPAEAGAPAPALLLVDDGSRDGTGARLAALAQQAPGRIQVLALEANGGKAEAVRRGLRAALAGGADIVGYFDADLSTPVSEIRRLLDIIARRPDTQAVTGARISLLGSDIHRSHVRHYLGRVFATMASLILQARIYDTQCGAKLFRRSAALEAALADPFLSRWAFDVELLGRLLIGDASTPPVGEARFLEVPLLTWRDVPGSKLNPRAMAGALKELAAIARDLAHRRRVAQPR